jgi:uncharacterized protein (UPF0210 family)
MRKIRPINLEFEYEDSTDNEKIIQRMYNRLFDLAKQKIISKKKLERENISKSPVRIVVKPKCDQDYNSIDQY